MVFLRKAGRETQRLRLLFLLPMTLAILAIVAAVAFLLHQHEQQELSRGMLHIRASDQEFYEGSIHHETRALQAVMDALQRDSVLHEALARKDRQKLLRHSATLFDELKRDLTVTHLYFSDPDRINLLRVHEPNRHGDRIDRITTLAAEKNGARSVGIELGPLGTFTLRLVTPWYDETTHQLIGYVELGMEVDRVLQQLHDFFGVDVFVLAHKDHLDRKQWEDGMRALGHSPDWERFPTVVMEASLKPQQAVSSSLLAEYFAQGPLGNAGNITEVRRGGASYQLGFLPLQDAGGRQVAHLALIADISQDADAALRTVYEVSLTTLGIGLLLLGFFYWQVGRIGRRLERDKQALEHLATHDGLTGLFSHRMHYQRLREEFARSGRTGQPISLLLLDIDYFKQVNDRYGHLAGDLALKTISDLVVGTCRAMDIACRYGGEEITVILPETGTDAAMIAAERLRKIIEVQAFDFEDKQSIHITVSIGVATSSEHLASAAELTNAADRAMYRAKEKGRNRVERAEDGGEAESGIAPVPARL